ncbi:hypothetical protein [Streptomyces erythrochromogenes]|uniref:hypothetical protein n=1 Tax=Streptomyces erythrochromogenes TaxID=285574 RepID=UPI00224F8703|nr:hypothetical protein [Streptomyces erythrochromogenes]MCX5587577.1 hypothetical protein [Streptomyces erythrochromogenes]
MATFTSRTITTTRREWIVPTNYPRGACLGDMEAALGAAARDYRHYYNLSDLVTLPDDSLSFTTTDEAIVIAFTVETPQP